MKVCEIIKILEQDGWYLKRTKGSHRQYKHPTKSATVTVSGKLRVCLKKQLGQLGIDKPYLTLMVILYHYFYRTTKTFKALLCR